MEVLHGQKHSPLVTTTERSGVPGEAKSVRALEPSPTPEPLQMPGLRVSPSSDGHGVGGPSTWV